eukprot:CAMPEP_0117474552 /NCGR_PEP_ID=MMETSP0784-20121206/9341_1 /TAXON_ID=39447 /ORGANISM="" /LENGTH=106 /DNA_ID=CAMNT_0005268777 /DNA_START=724 /DNA_END=1041 /DNA_ORIENTATION=-
MSQFCRLLVEIRFPVGPVHAEVALVAGARKARKARHHVLQGIHFEIVRQLISRSVHIVKAGARLRGAWGSHIRESVLPHGFVAGEWLIKPGLSHRLDASAGAAHLR